MNRIIILFLIGTLASFSGYAQRIKPSKSTSRTSAAKPVLTQEKLTQIKIGLTKYQIRKLLGSNGEEVTTTRGGGQTFNVVKWVDAKYNFAVVTFKNGRVMTVSTSADDTENDLTPASVPPLTPEKFDQVKIGLTRDQVRQIFERDGEHVSTSRGGGITYEVVKWVDADYNYMIVTFENGIVWKVYNSTFK